MPTRSSSRHINLDWFQGRNSLWIKVDTSGEGCWPWLLSTGSHGYGQIWDGTTNHTAHRVAFALWHGRQIPDGLVIDHVCHNRICCNPAHLRELTNKDNSRDNGQGAKTHCPAGHPYLGENLYVDRRGHRRCRACARARR